MIISATATSAGDYVSQASQTGWISIEGCNMALPGRDSDKEIAVLILNIPHAYLLGGDFPHVMFGIEHQGAIVAEGGFSYECDMNDDSKSRARMPMTLVCRVDLPIGASPVQAKWKVVRGGGFSAGGSEPTLNAFTSKRDIA